MEPRVQERVEVLLRSLKAKSEGRMVAETDEYGFGKGWRYGDDGRVVFDIRPWLNMLSYDAITAMFWSDTYGMRTKRYGRHVLSLRTIGCLERGSDLVPAQRKTGRFDRVHAMASFHGTTSFL